MNFSTQGAHAVLASAVYEEVDTLRNDSAFAMLRTQFDFADPYDQNGDVVYTFVDKSSGQAFIVARGTDHDGFDRGQWDEIAHGELTELGAITAGIARAQFDLTGEQVIVIGHSLGGHAAEEAARLEPDAVKAATNVQGPSVVDLGEERGTLVPRLRSTDEVRDPIYNLYRAIAEAQKSDPDYIPPDNVTRIVASDYVWAWKSSAQSTLDGTGVSIFPPNDIAIDVPIHSHSAVVDYYRRELFQAAIDALHPLVPTFASEDPYESPTVSSSDDDDDRRDLRAGHEMGRSVGSVFTEDPAEPYYQYIRKEYTPGEYEAKYDPNNEQIWSPETNVTVTERTYTDTGSTTILATDKRGNGTFDTGAGATYTMSDYGAEMPIIIDLDATPQKPDGIEITNTANVEFDVDNDGYVERTSWVGTDDGFLVIDLSANGKRPEAGIQADGKITHTKEVFWTRWLAPGEAETDLEALQILLARDGWGDGNLVLNSNDAVWESLRIWQDKNQNGVVDQDLDELNTLDDLGFTEFNLFYDDNVAFTADDDVHLAGSTLHGVATYTRNGGTIEGGIGDVGLHNAVNGWKEVWSGDIQQIKFEVGGTLRYRVMDGSGAANTDLDDLALDGVTGDDRANLLTAENHSRNVQISGGSGNDTVFGGGSDDTLAGDAGDDRIFGRNGNDELIVDSADLATAGNVKAGAGIDTIIVVDHIGVSFNLIDLEAEAAFGGTGDDVISGVGLSEDLPIYGGQGADRLIGGDGDDVLSGDEAGDTVEGRAGSDTLDGGGGHDTLKGGGGDDVIFGRDQDDDIHGGEGDDSLHGGKGADSLAGFGGDDELYGESGHDILDGGGGDDRLIGHSGDDSFYFWRGDDELFGGGGDDTFYLQGGTQYADDRHWGWAIVAGGKGNDRLVLTDKDDLVGHTIRKVGGSQSNQWQLLLHENNAERIVIDLIDIEEIEFSDGSLYIGALSADEDLTTSSDYIRSDPGDGIYDDSIVVFGDGSVSGYMGDDQISASSYGNGAGEQTMIGGTGDDVIFGGNSDDSINGSSGSDNVQGGNNDDEVVGGTGADLLYGGAGNDTVTGGSGADTLLGDGGNDALYAGAGRDYVYGGDDRDVLYGGDGADLLSGGSDHDTLFGEVGADQLYGGSGNDTLDGDAGFDRLWGEDGRDTLFGGNGHDMLYGGDQSDLIEGGLDDDVLVGGSGNDTLRGDNGRDLLQGGSGDDVLNGGGGSLDIANYQGSDAAVVIDLSIASASGGDAENDTILNIEGVYGSDHADTLTGGNADNILQGGGGEDSIYGGDGHDNLEGGDQYDDIYGGVGDDRVWGGNGRDDVWLGAGNDAFYDNSQDDEHSHDKARGGDGADELYGGGGNETFWGNNGADELFGGIGDDELIGGNGDDTLDGGSGADTLLGDAGDDDIRGKNGADTLEGGDGNDILRGENGDDIIKGQGDDDDVRGGFGNDSLWGNNGSDTLRGGEGDDVLRGGSGADIFIIENSFGQDRIEDFLTSVAGEFIDLSAVTAINNYGDLSNNHLAQSGSDAEISVGGNVLVLVNINVSDLSDGDFIF